MTTPDPKRRRKTKAEREAEAAAVADRPIDPLIWIILGALILFMAFWTWVDPVTFAEAGSASNQNVLQLVPLLMIRLFGMPVGAIILTVIGLIPFGFGVIGWLRNRLSDKTK